MSEREQGAAQALADAVILQTVRLLRHIGALRKSVDAAIVKLSGQLQAQAGGTAMADMAPAGRREVVMRAQDEVRQAYRGISDAFEDAMLGLSETVADMSAKALDKVVPIIPVDITVQHLTPEMAAKLMQDHLLMGAPIKDWWEAQSADTAFRLANAIRQGMAEGEANAEIARRISGEDGVIGLSRRHARSLVHTAVMSVANATRQATWQANGDIVRGQMQVSTLDGHTSTVCIAYSGGKWDLEGNPIEGTALAFNGGPPRHRNCRSVLVPLLHSFKSQGIDLPDINMTTRASRDGPVPANWSFSDWLERQTDSFQDDLLGKGRAALWRAKKITLQDLLDQSGRELTLDELRALVD